MEYWQEFMIIATVHLLAVASPGPDFAIILKQSLRFGRETALYTSLGIGTGILLHVAYSIVGIGILIASNETLFTALKFIAAGYFFYIAWHGLRAKASDYQKQKEVIQEVTLPTKFSAFRTGFLINGLNVKATLFFVSLFSMVISPTTPINIQLIYGVYMALATAVWFSALSLLIGHPTFRNKLLRKGYWLDRIMGAVLAILAIELLQSEINL